MSGIKYYQLANGEELPDEFCAVRDVGGEPSEYVFYVPESENAKLREERNHWHVEQVHAYGNWEDAHKRAIELEKQNAKLREHIADLWEFGFSKNAGANSIKEYLRRVDELRDRTYELLGAAK